MGFANAVGPVVGLSVVAGLLLGLEGDTGFIEGERQSPTPRKDVAR